MVGLHFQTHNTLDDIWIISNCQLVDVTFWKFNLTCPIKPPTIFLGNIFEFNLR